jgi:hypothetical protein
MAIYQHLWSFKNAAGFRNVGYLAKRVYNCAYATERRSRDLVGHVEGQDSEAARCRKACSEGRATARSYLLNG